MRLTLIAAAAAACSLAAPAEAAFFYRVDVESHESGITGSFGYTVGSLTKRSADYRLDYCTLSAGCAPYIEAFFDVLQPFGGYVARAGASRLDVYFTQEQLSSIGVHQATQAYKPACCDFTTGAVATLTITTDGVPEPATWALMILGFGATGAAMRRSKGGGVRRLA